MKKTILIADSGSTKTDWRLAKSDKATTSFSSIGLNPYFVDQITLKNTLSQIFNQSLSTEVDEVFFYGAGCSSEKAIEPFEIGFQQHFPHAKIHILHDMLGAAVALFGKEKGLAIILGTGSNSCLYNGSQVINNIPALGYVMGDEGSGAHLGKLLLAKYIYQELDHSLLKKLNHLASKEDILKNVYSQPFPNRYLASFSRFVSENIDHPQMQQLVKDSFELFFDKHVIPYPNYHSFPLGIVGSIGYIFQDFVKDIALEKGLTIKKIVRSPIEELVKFHTS